MAGRKGSGTKVQLSTGTVRLTRLDLASVQLAGVWRGAPTLSTSQLDWTGNIDPGVYVLGAWEALSHEESVCGRCFRLDSDRR